MSSLFEEVLTKHEQQSDSYDGIELSLQAVTASRAPGIAEKSQYFGSSL